MNAGFSGNERFEVTQVLGEGSFGVVYAARDRSSGQPVALKLLRSAKRAQLSGFKREFRALADIAHPNLASLYELIHSDGRWFYTMELVSGVDILQHVRRDVGRLWGSQSSIRVTDSTDSQNIAARERLGGGTQILDDAEVYGLELVLSEDASLGLPVGATAPTPRAIHALRSVFPQLVDGVLALHAAGMLHRDIKPSNVMVSDAGVVKLLDFGLVFELGATDSPGLAGTPAFIAPEVLLSGQVGPEADWYAVGVLLFEALTGVVPFDGTSRGMSVRKLREDAPRCSELVDGVPADLDDLCARLLDRRPEVRPDDREMVTWARTALPVVQVRTYSSETFGVAASPAYRALAAAFEHVESEGGEAWVAIRGGSGSGKSTTLERFLAAIKAAEAATVLHGRCHPREQLPFKAVDGVVDDLAAHLRRMPAEEFAAVLPSSIHHVARLFPVIGELVGSAANPIVDEDDFSSRMRAFEALGRLMVAACAGKPLVIGVDDVHWGDADAARLLATVLRRHGGCPLLVVTTRQEDVGPSSFELAMAELVRRLVVPAPVEVTLEPLSETEARVLIERRAARSDLRICDELASRLVNESAGNAMLLDMLVDHVVRLSQEELAQLHGQPGLLEAVVVARRAPLSPAARIALDVLVAAGRPVSTEELLDVAGLREAQANATRELIVARLAREVDVRGQRLLTVYCPPFRSVLHHRVDPVELQHIHQRFADHLQAHGGDAVVRARHLLELGRRTEAMAVTRAAAKQASENLAFELSCDLYQQVVELARADELDVELRLAHAEALARVGRGRAAAAAYLEAARLVSGDAAPALRLQAADQLLRTGELVEGLVLVEAVLDSAPTRAAGGSAYRRMARQLRDDDMAYEPRDEQEVPPGQLHHIDAYASAAASLAIADPVRGAAYQCEHLLLALDAGEPRRVARALALQASYASINGRPEKALVLLRRAAAVSGQLGDRSLVSTIAHIRAGIWVLSGNWSRARQAASEAVKVISRQSQRATGEMEAARIYLLQALESTGAWQELATHLAPFLGEAQDRENRYAETMYRARFTPLLLLASGDLPRARRELDFVRDSLPDEPRLLQHAWVLFSSTRLDLAAGDAELAWLRLETEWKSLRRWSVLAVAAHRHEAHLLLGLSAICAARNENSGRQRALQTAARTIRSLATTRQRSAVASAALLTAGIELLRGRHEASADRLAAAERGFEAEQMMVHAAVARYTRGRLTGGDTGAELTVGATESLRAAGIFDVEAVCRAFAFVL